MTLAIAVLVAPPALWLADRLFNRGELFTLIREELHITPTVRTKAAKRIRITTARR